jgi:hypothetical protein
MLTSSRSFTKHKAVSHRTVGRRTGYRAGSIRRLGLDLACEKAERQARLIELDPSYVDVIIHRFQDYAGKTAVLDGDGRSYEDIAASREAA